MALSTDVVNSQLSVYAAQPQSTASNVTACNLTSDKATSNNTNDIAASNNNNSATENSNKDTGKDTGDTKENAESSIISNFKEWVKAENVDEIISFFIPPSHLQKIQDQAMDILVENPDLVARLFEYPAMVEYFLTAPSGIVREEQNLISAHFSAHREERETAIDYLRIYLDRYSLSDKFELLKACLKKNNPQLFKRFQLTKDMWSFEINREVIKLHKKFFKIYMELLGQHDQAKLLQCIDSESFPMFIDICKNDCRLVLKHVEIIKKQCAEDAKFLDEFYTVLDDCLIQELSNWLKKKNNFATKCQLLDDILKYYPEFIEKYPNQLMKIETYFHKRMTELTNRTQQRPKTNNYFSNEFYNYSTAVDDLKTINDYLASLEKHPAIKTQKYQSAVSATHALIVPGLPREYHNDLYRKEMVTTWTPRYYTMELQYREGEYRYYSYCMRHFLSDAEALIIKRQLEEAEKIRSLGQSSLVVSNGRRALPFQVSKQILSFLYPAKANKKLLIEFIDTAAQTAAKHVASKQKA